MPCELTLAPVAEKDRVIHFEFGSKWLQLLDGIVDRDADGREALRTVLLLKFHEPRNLDLARRAPRRPEVEDDHLALERCQIELFAVDVGQREIQIGHFGRLVTRRASLGGCTDVGQPHREHQQKRNTQPRDPSN